MCKPKPVHFKRLIAALLVFSPWLTSGQNSHELGFPAGIRIAAKARGEAALTAFHGKSARQFHKIFQTDNSLCESRGTALLHLLASPSCYPI